MGHTGLHPETQVLGPGWDVWGPGRGDGSAVPSTAPLPSLAISAAWAPSSPLASFPLHCRPTLLRNPGGTTEARCGGEEGFF